MVSEEAGVPQLVMKQAFTRRKLLWFCTTRNEGAPGFGLSRLCCSAPCVKGAACASSCTCTGTICAGNRCFESTWINQEPQGDGP